MQRFFFDTQPLKIGRLCISDQNLLHHFRVLRLQRGDHINLFDGNGRESQAVITELDRRTATVNIKSTKIINRELPFHTCLVQGLCSSEKMDWLIEKTVELGVCKIQPIICTRSTAKIAEKKMLAKLEHWQKRIVSACEQSGRNVLPTIAQPVPFTKWLAKKNFSTQPCAEKLLFVLSPNTTTSFKENVPKKQPNQVEILIGPEGGLTNEEADSAILHGYKPITIGPRILRTETAGITMLSALATYWNSF